MGNSKWFRNAMKESRCSVKSRCDYREKIAREKPVMVDVDDCIENPYSFIEPTQPPPPQQQQQPASACSLPDSDVSRPVSLPVQEETVLEDLSMELGEYETVQPEEVVYHMEDNWVVLSIHAA
eukprot:TRINITY_DN995_c0_g1_i2.p2 TRINITY_DN995_c0_g1~~TRINITY_DN995_c0_g1_i2.p2  ORF type:complete len:123 (-),score=28.58 TRINITY_DN995_c0_g1_i2:87-455(-)